jgi:hypothetical protein
MSGSQPATVGELHPLHRKALRHPLILDGLSPTSRLRRFVETGSTRHRCASIEDLCLHVLSSFQRTGLARHRRRAEARSQMCPPASVSPLGEPYNLTSAFLFVSTPRRHFLSSFSGVAISLQRNDARRKTAWGLCEPEGLLEEPATGRVTLGRTNIRGDPGTVNPGCSKGRCSAGSAGLSHQLDDRTFTTC